MHLALVTAALLAAAGRNPGAAPEGYDLLLRGGRVVDGTGNPWFVADVAIRDGRVAAVGRLGGAPARKVIDVGGLTVAPGFIDVHGHIEDRIVSHPDAANFVSDGVTSIVTGNCGFSRTDVGAFLGDVDRMGAGLNVATLIGHNNVRREVMGYADRAPSAEEQARMEAL